MNIVQHERPERVLSSMGLYGLTSSHAKFFATPVESKGKFHAGFGRGHGSAFKGLPVCGHEGLWFSAHLSERDELFGDAWSIYTESFASAERRSRREQARVMRHPRYRFSAIMHESAVVGVMAWWAFEGFCFVEHFAIAEAFRSGGFGRRAMGLLQAHAGRPIVLDVEPFGTDWCASRRVAFYQRLGFAYSGRQVVLPAYGGKPLAPSNLMAWGCVLDRAGHERVLETIGCEIYGLRSEVSYPSAV